MRAGSSFAKRRSSTTGRPSYPLLTLFHSLLRGIWHKLLEEHLAVSLARDLLFRRFCSLESSGDTPDATTLDRFRQQLVQYDFWERFPEEVNRQLKQRNRVSPRLWAEGGCM